MSKGRVRSALAPNSIKGLAIFLLYGRCQRVVALKP
jgi:hypothetical protein